MCELKPLSLLSSSSAFFKVDVKVNQPHADVQKSQLVVAFRLHYRGYLIRLSYIGWSQLLGISDSSDGVGDGT